MKNSEYIQALEREKKGVSSWRGMVRAQYFYFTGRKRKVCLLLGLIHWRGRNRRRDWESGRTFCGSRICAARRIENVWRLPGMEIFLFSKHERSLSKGYFSCFDLNPFPFVHTAVARESNWRDPHREKPCSQIEIGTFFCLFPFPYLSVFD